MDPMTFPVSYMAHCHSCHRDTAMNIDSAAREPGSYRCGECFTVQIVHPCIVLDHTHRFTPEGEVLCIQEDRVLSDVEYEAMMDAMAWTSRPADRPCCRAAGLVPTGGSFSTHPHFERLTA